MFYRNFSAVLIIVFIAGLLASCSGNRNRVFAFNQGVSDQSEYKISLANNKIYWEPFAPAFQIQIFAGEKPIELLFNNNRTGVIWSIQAPKNQSLTPPIELPTILVDGNIYTIYLQAEDALYSQDGILVFKYVKQ